MISVIIPVYNVEKYIERCVESVINQTYKDLQIILIDDGSIDESGALCDQYAIRDSRVEVIHKKNEGLSSARNAGLLAARGEFITFVDSDDWVAEDTYEYTHNILCEYSVDAVQFGIIETNKPCRIKNRREQLQLIEGKAINQFYLEFSTKTGCYSVCNYLFKARLLQGTFFREGKINEDIDYTYKVLDKCNSLAVSNQTKYFYFQTEKSLSAGGLKKEDFDLYEAAEELSRMTECEEYGEIRHLGQIKKSRTAFSLLSKIAYYGISDDSINRNEVVKKLQKENRENLPILINSQIPLSRKILAISYAISFEGSRLIISRLHSWGVI